MLQLLACKTPEIPALVAIIWQLSRASEVPEDVRFVAGGEVLGLEVDALAGAQESG